MNDINDLSGKSDMSDNARPVTILLCALGGEGGGVLSEWLVDAARQAGHAVQATSIPGVAQRTGATTYYVEIFPLPIAQLGGRRPVFSLYPVPGALDLLVSSELLETVRQIGNGMSSPQRTQLISSSTRALTTHERMQLGDGRVPDEPLREVVRRYSREHHLFDMGAVTRETGTVVSAVMFGAIAASGALPFPREACEAVVRAGGRGVEASLAGFARAFEIVAGARGRASFVQQVVAGAGTRPAAPADATRTSPAVPALPADVAGRFPPATHDMLGLGHARMLDYQDHAYAGLYLERMARIHAAECSGDPQGAQGWATTREMARYLALWMAFDDIVRVADLKCRAARHTRVRGEVKVQGGELLRVYEHFKPGVPEIAALLPAWLAEALTRWDRRRQARGLAPFAVPLKVGSHSVTGFVALRLLAGLRGMRRRGARFAQEQALIERWVGAVERGAAEHWSLGHEIALCGRLVKGYGSTNERGKDNLLHIVDHLAKPDALVSPAARAEAIRSARSAALADEAGTLLDQTLLRHGAPARAPKEMPIRFVRRAKPQAAARDAAGASAR
ncbi:MAG: indolepyruvate oxidoreductase subunit beta family protein [Rhizobacter sp.]|nr:indolepyruvate oxidoreductase subunit beta family protein [Rhizobacter sp.]